MHRLPLTERHSNQVSTHLSKRQQVQEGPATHVEIIDVLPPIRTTV